MRIEKVHIKGFRNFADAEFKLGNKTLVLGSNDSGKTNLLYALRILFDPGFSARQFELTASDFNSETAADRVEIYATLGDVCEPCLVSAFAGRLINGQTQVGYYCTKDGDYGFVAGIDADSLEAVESRFYIRHLVLEYVDSTRDASAFLKRSQALLLESARNARNAVCAQEDETSIRNIQGNLESLNNGISKLHYIADALKAVNEQMGRMSALNNGREARLVAGNTDAGKLLDNLQLAYLSDDSPLTFGGEGRDNQLFFSTWLSQRNIRKSVEKVSIVAIEEPEAHLHPQQQRALAKYLSTCIEGQVVLTTHSPQIIEPFASDALVMMGGNMRPICSGPELGRAVDGLGYRLNPIVAEVFFSRGVFLVEGPSEVMLFKALACAINIDIDRENLSILSVNGVGFKPYVSCCNALGIPWVMRTDNDVMKIPREDRYQLAGVKRAYEIAELLDDAGLEEKWRSLCGLFVWESNPSVPHESDQACRDMASALEKKGIYLSNRDLEHDLIASKLHDSLAKHYGTDDVDALYAAMTYRKAEGMHAFVQENGRDLGLLATDDICKPLRRLLEIVSSGSGND